MRLGFIGRLPPCSRTQVAPKADSSRTGPKSDPSWTQIGRSDAHAARGLMCSGTQTDTQREQCVGMQERPPPKKMGETKNHMRFFQKTLGAN